MSFEHNDVQWGSLPSGFSHSDIMFGKITNYAILVPTQDDEETEHGTPPNYWCGAAHNAWGTAEWKLIPQDSRGNGNIRVTVYVDSGYAPTLKIMRGSWGDPDLTGDTSTGTNWNWVAGDEYAFVGSGGYTYQEGYFSMSMGWDNYNMCCHIKKIEWRVGVGSYETVWEENIQGSFNHSCVRFT